MGKEKLEDYGAKASLAKAQDTIRSGSWIGGGVGRKECREKEQGWWCWCLETNGSGNGQTPGLSLKSVT